MRPNQAFQRAIHALTHPISIAAILVLLFNDHWLRWHYPSWLTGKLGDFAWLVFAPLIAALVFSWIIPRRLNRHEFIIGVASFTFIGLWFALAKTDPFVHHLTVTALERIIGWQTTLRMDTSDLLALPGLLVGYWIWQYGGSISNLFRRHTIRVVFTLGIMATLATSMPPSDSGLTCVLQFKQKLVVFGHSSSDGGLTWQPVKTTDAQTQPAWADNCWKNNTDSDFILIDPSNKNIQYRFQHAKSIDRSVDGGQTWKVDIDLSELSQEVRRYYHAQKPDRLSMAVNTAQKSNRFSVGINAYPGPYSAIIDENTGNLVVAMGQDGMLVRTPDDQWHWIEIGSYHRVNIYRFDLIFDLLKGELILSGVFMLLVFATHFQPYKPSFAMIMLAFAWVLWIFGVGLPAPKLGDDGWLNFGVLTYFSNLLAAMIALLSIVGVIADIRDKKIFTKQIRETILLSIGSGILFLFPYLLWSQGTIPAYFTASVFALLLGLSAAFGVGQYLKRRYPTTSVETASESQRRI